MRPAGPWGSRHAHAFLLSSGNEGSERRGGTWRGAGAAPPGGPQLSIRAGPHLVTRPPCLKLQGPWAPPPSPHSGSGCASSLGSRHAHGQWLTLGPPASAHAPCVTRGVPTQPGAWAVPVASVTHGEVTLSPGSQASPSGHVPHTRGSWEQHVHGLGGQAGPGGRALRVRVLALPAGRMTVSCYLSRWQIRPNGGRLGSSSLPACRGHSTQLTVRVKDIKSPKQEAWWPNCHLLPLL